MSLLTSLAQLAMQHLEIVIFLVMGFFAYTRIRQHQKKHLVAAKLLKQVVTNKEEPISLHPVIDDAKCTGCAACTNVCPEGDILQIVNHKAVLVGPSKCVGHGECERACPMNAITLVFGTKTRGVDIPRVTTDYETNVSGLYIAGELGGMGLIRNAVKQGVAAAEHALESLPSSRSADFDLFIVGAGPAGLSAALVAIAKKKKYKLIEQNSFGGTVYNFPRQKIVMSHPAKLPLVGDMKFPGNKISKEELLGYWNKIRKQAGLQVTENTKFETLRGKDGHFEVSTNGGTFTASKVILAMGVRGTPRKLGLPNEDLPKVTYNLLEPEQYQGKEICVVGGGNAGVEAAASLAHPKLKNKVKLLVRGNKFDRCNEENQKTIFQLADKNLVDIWFESSVKSITPEHLVIQRKTQEEQIDNDYLFIFAGAELPSKFLLSLGVEMDRKFGEGLRKTS